VSLKKHTTRTQDCSAILACVNVDNETSLPTPGRPFSESDRVSFQDAIPVGVE
jgi:hypothetical protein